MPKPTVPGTGAHMRAAPAKLLQTAVESFARKGFEGASFREIAETAGFAFQLISYHFGSKEELWRACITNLASIYDEAMNLAEVQAPTMESTLWLRQWMRTGFLFTVEEPQLTHMLTHESFSNSKRYQDIVLPLVEGLDRRTLLAFAKAHERGAITHVSSSGAGFLFKSVTSANAHFPHEVEQAIGIPRNSPASIEYQLDLLGSIFRTGRGVPPRHPKSAGTGRSPGRFAGAAAGPARKVRTPSRNQARQRLMESAMETFSRTSYDGASMRRIAKAAGMAHPLVGYYFGSKEDLWATVLQEAFERRLTFFRSAVVPTAGDPRTQIRTWIQAALADAIGNPALRRIIALESFAGSERYKKKLKPRIAKLLSASNFIVDRIIGTPTADRFSSRELQLLLRSVLCTNALAPEEVRIWVEQTGTKKSPLEWQVDLLTNLIVDGHDEPPNKRKR